MNSVTKKLLDEISNWKEGFSGAYSIREDGKCAELRSTEHVLITPKTEKPGLDIHILPNTKGETVSIPACVTHGDVDDLVYNDFYVGEGAQVTIVAGCGVHTETGEPARHNGIHRFFLEPGAQVKYIEKHVGTGKGPGIRSIDPVTEAELGEGTVLKMETSQIGGVDRAYRKTKASLGKNAKLIVKESILTENEQEASTEFEVFMEGEGSAVDLISRSVARGESHQAYHSRIIGNAPCTGHSECDAILAEHGRVDAAPELSANHCDAELIHEAAIGKIAGEQILKLRTFGLTEKEAEEKIIEGFLN